MNVYRSLFVFTMCATASVMFAGCAREDVGVADDAREPVVSEAKDAEAAEKAGEAKDAGKAVEAAEAAEAVSDDDEITDDTVVAEVEGEKLTYGEAMKTIKRVLVARGAAPEQVDMLATQMAAIALPEIAEGFVGSALLKSEAVKRGFGVAAADIDEAVSNIVANLPEDMTFDDFIEKQGLTQEEARKGISDELTINKLVEDITKAVEIDEEAVTKFYEENERFFERPEQVEASHILVKIDEADATNETAKAAARAKAESIRAQILDGTNFAELAAIHSDCPSKLQGGNLGFFTFIHNYFFK